MRVMWRSTTVTLAAVRGPIRMAAIVAAVAMGLASSAVAQPSLSAVSGVVANGQTVTVSGSGFGTKPTAAPLVWEDFSDGQANGLTLHGSINTANTTDLRHQFATRNARADFKAPGPGHYYSYDAAAAPKWFTQYWIKLASNWQFGSAAYPGPGDGLANIKFWRNFPLGSRNFTNVDVVLHGFAGYSWKYAIAHEGSTNETFIQGLGDFRETFTNGNWHCVQVEYGENSAVNATDGVFKVWVNGRSIVNLTNVVTNESSDGAWVAKRPYVIGFYDSWSPSDAPVSNMYAYYSDIYVDNVWSRVVVANAPTYATATLRELQKPTAWATGAVTFNVNQGAFATGQAAYLYVVDSAGRVNATGLPLTIGGGTTTAPKAPTNLRIVG
jgi:hypothetical protein